MSRRGHRPGAVAWALAALLVWSLALRVGFASFDLHAGRFFDERYSLENIRSLLAGELRPANGWYPSLAYLPQAGLLGLSEALHRATGAPVFAVFADGGFSPTAYLLCRLSVALFGVLTLWSTFLLGRRLFSPAVGLWAALLVSVVPAHIRLSAYFKPDMLLLLLVLSAFHLTLRVVERPETGRHLTAGAGVGLAAASKLTGALAAIPLAAVALLLARRDRRQLARLAGAGLVAAAVFLALNPFVGLQLDHLRRNAAIYEERAILEGVSRLDAPLEGLKLLVSPGFHGPWVGGAGLVGLVALGAHALRRWSSERLLVPVFAGGYLLAYGATTPYPKANNFLVVVPFTALAAAWLARTLAGRLTGGWPPRRRRWAAAAASLLLVALLLPPAQLYAYRAAVPPAARLARDVLRRELRPLAGRTVIYEGEEPLPLLTRREAVAMRRVEDLPRADPQLLERADAELFPRRRLEGPGGEAYRRRLEGLPAERVRHLEAVFGRVRGPALVLVLHPWNLLGRTVVALPAEASGPTPVVLAEPLPAAALVSAQLLFHGSERPPGTVGLTVEGEPVGLTLTRIARGGYVWGHAYTSGRFRVAEGGPRLVFVLPPGAPAPRPHRVDVLRWGPR